ncbi:MAG TPA: radical SAM protein [Verrucomicrobiae bacterium]|nr:radical SAM protein [Verrucomicrobiae bacterium]
MFVQHGSESVVLDDAGERLATLPILVLNVHSRCNCRCLMCDIWKREESNEITAADLERHRESLRRLRVEWVVLSGGEPLMNRDLRGLCTFLRDLDIRLTLLTTGLLLERRTIDVADLFDDVIISLDGPREIHDAVRRVKGAFDLIQSGVASIRKRRPEIRITARTTVQKTNHAHLRETALGAKEVGLDGISFLAADLTSEAFNRPLLWPGERQSEVGLSESEVEVLADEVESLIAWCECEASGHYVAESPAKLRRIVRHFRAHLGQASIESPKCNAPWVSAVVEADGTVRPCFFHRPVGSIASTDLEEIINGEAARAFRRDLNIRSNPVCRRCVCSLYRDQPFKA